jgi:hypothetical protein
MFALSTPTKPAYTDIKIINKHQIVDADKLI